MDGSTRVIAETNYLRLVEQNEWSYVERMTSGGVVGIVARTKDDQIVLVEQYRAPVNRRVIELPAGLCGDLAGQPDEPLESAAIRELLEETGYQASSLENIGAVASSAGLTNEITTLFVADNIDKVAAGGGDESEDITIHEIPLDDIHNWLLQARTDGKLIDSRVYGGLYFLMRTSAKRER